MFAEEPLLQMCGLCGESGPYADPRKTHSRCDPGPNRWRRERLAQTAPVLTLPLRFPPTDRSVCVCVRVCVFVCLCVSGGKHLRLVRLFVLSERNPFSFKKKQGHGITTA